MRLARASGVLFVAGLLGGSLSDPGHAVIHPQAGGYWVLAADLHVHGFFGDGALPPWEIRAEARRRGLDVVALSNHNQRIAVRLDRWLFGRTDPLVLDAEEITASHYHLIAIGISRTIGWRQSAAQAIASIHAQGGAAIAAHPVRVFWAAYDAPAAASLDGAEIAHPIADGDPAARAELTAFWERARDRNPRVAPIGSSDFHFRAPIGLCRTYVFAREPTEQGVIDAVRGGRTVAYDSDGRAYGDPAFAAIADGLRRSHAEEPGVFARLSLLLTVLGLAGLILLRR
jgi:hypothetical protein